MIKHKSNPAIKHPDRYIPPWERKITGDLNFGKWADPMEEKLYKARNGAFAFDLMIYWSLHGKNFDAGSTVIDWYYSAFRRDCPEADYNLEEIYCLIKRGLLIRGYESVGLQYDEETDDVRVPASWDDWETIKNKTIKFNKEYSMAIIAKKMPKKAEPAPAPVKGKKRAEEPEAPEGVTVRMTQKAQATIACANLLLEEKYTDDEIIQKVEEEVGYKFEVGMIRRRRRMLNEGQLEEFGFEAPAQPLAEIGGEPEEVEEEEEVEEAPRPAKKVIKPAPRPIQKPVPHPVQKVKK